MQKLNMYKIYQVQHGDLNKENFTEIELLEREITLSSNNLIRKYLKFKGIKQNDILLDNIIKVALPTDEKGTENEKAMELLKNGITFRGKRFIPLISSPSMMKAEDIDDFYEEEFKCEYLFIAEEDQEFVSNFEDITSLGKLTEKRKNKEELALNKDVIARLSLTTSSSYEIKYKPNVAVLESDKYIYIADYCYFADGNYTELKYERNKAVEHEFQDGCGLMSPALATIIQENLKCDYPIDWVGIRMDKGLAIKGLLVKVDFISYFEEMYKGDTPYFWKKGGDFYTFDYWKQEVNLSKVDMIINTNMAKWAKFWENMKDIETELKDPKYKNYRHILTNLYVTQFNKKQPKEYSRTNYQLISNLALTSKDLEELSKETYDIYNKVLDFDIDTIRMMLGDLVEEEHEELNVMDKVHYLLQSTEETLTITSVKKAVVSMIKKKMKELAAGKFFIKGNFKVASTCPITFMDWIMCRDLAKCNQGLKVGEFYIPKEQGNRVMSRNPLNSFSEIHRFTIANNDLLEKHCGHLTNEIIFFNQKDNRAMLNSGEDFDTDKNLVVDNDIIYNAVIPPQDGYQFLNVDDNKDSVTHKYTKENEYYCVLKASGNAIGSIANLGMKICTSATEIGYYYPEKNRSFGYVELREAYYEVKKEWLEENIREIKQLQMVQSELAGLELEEKENGYMWDDEYRLNHEFTVGNLLEREYDLSKIVNEKKKAYFTEELEKKIEAGELVAIETLKEDEMRRILIQQFYKYKTQSYLALQLQMISIDMPKTLKSVDEDLIKLLKEQIAEDKDPVFRKYVTPYKDRLNKKGREKHYSLTRSALNIHAMKIGRDLLKKQKEIYDSINGDKIGCINSILNHAKVTDNTETVTESMTALWNAWKFERDRINTAWKENKTKRNEELRKNDLHISQKVTNLVNNNDMDTMGSALLKASKLRSKKTEEEKADTIRTIFILDCCFNILQPLLEKYYNDIYAYEENENGEYYYLFKNYTKVKKKRRELNLQDMQNKESAIRLQEVVLLKFRPISMDEEFIIKRVADQFYINQEAIFNNKVTGGKGKKTYDLLEELLGDKEEMKVQLQDIVIKETYISCCVNMGIA